MMNRKGRLPSPIAKLGREYLIENYLPEFCDFNDIIGYRVDDSYFSFAHSFLTNTISLKQLGNAMYLRELDEQFVLKSEKAFDAIRFIDYTIAYNSEYYAKRKARDNKARIAYYKQLEEGDLNGIFMMDIIREEIKSNDSCLRYNML